MSRLQLSILLLTSVATIAVPGCAWAAAPDVEAAETQTRDASETITITGRQAQAVSKLAAKQIEFGNAVQVVGAPDIAASGSINFAEAIQFLVKGANIGYSPDEGEYTIRLDGGGDRDTLVVLDGVPLCRQDALDRLAVGKLSVLRHRDRRTGNVIDNSLHRSAIDIARGVKLSLGSRSTAISAGIST